MTVITLLVCVIQYTEQFASAMLLDFFTYSNSLPDLMGKGHFHTLSPISSYFTERWSDEGVNGGSTIYPRHCILRRVLLGYKCAIAITHLYMLCGTSQVEHIAVYKTCMAL